MAQSKIIKRITENAEALHDVRRSIDAAKEKNRKEMEVLETLKDKLSDELIADLNAQGLKSIKVKSGDTFTKATKRGVEVTNEISAMKWAINNRAVSINKIIAGQMLREAEELPDGFKLVESEYISVRKPSQPKTDIKK